MQVLLQEQADLRNELREMTATVDRDNRARSAEETARVSEILARLTVLQGEDGNGGDIGQERAIQDALRAQPSVPDLSQHAEEAVRNLTAPRAPAPFAASDWRTALGLQLIAVREAALHPHLIDPRLLDIQAAATGASEGVPSDGGFAVQHDVQSELLREIHAMSAVASRTRRIPVSANSNGLKINGVDETSRVTGSRWGGATAYWTAEAGAMTSSKPKYRRIDLELNDLTALYYATNNLIQDAAALGAAAGQAFIEELSFKVDDALFRGTGAGMPLGIIGHAGTVSITKETNQPAATVLKANLQKMFARHMNPGRAEWYINQDVWPALFDLSHEVGVGGVPVFMPPGGLSAAPFGMILGRPIVPVEYCETLGTVGDVILADWSQYITIDKGGVEQASSIHVAFLTNEQVFRWVLRFDGQPIRNSALTPFKGTNTTAPFITLATRA